MNLINNQIDILEIKLDRLRRLPQSKSHSSADSKSRSLLAEFRRQVRHLYPADTTGRKPISDSPLCDEIHCQ
jgi:hypothetical protein